MDGHGEKPIAEGYHANGQSDSEVWSEPVTEHSEARRPRLSFTDTYVQIVFNPTHKYFYACNLTLSHHQVIIRCDNASLSKVCPTA